MSEQDILLPALEWISPRQRWEYTSEQHQRCDMDRMANILGAECWEMVGFVDDGDGWVTMMFKRPLEDQ